MSRVDMSAKAVTVRLKRVAQLRRLGLSLRGAKIRPRERSDTVRSIAGKDNANQMPERNAESESKTGAIAPQET